MNFKKWGEQWGEHYLLQKLTSIDLLITLFLSNDFLFLEGIKVRIVH